MRAAMIRQRPVRIRLGTSTFSDRLG